MTGRLRGTESVARAQVVDGFRSAELKKRASYRATQPLKEPSFQSGTVAGRSSAANPAWIQTDCGVGVASLDSELWRGGGGWKVCLPLP